MVKMDCSESITVIELHQIVSGDTKKAVPLIVDLVFPKEKLDAPS